MNTFVTGFFFGIAFAALVMFVVGAFLVTHLGDRVDYAADEHAQALGFDPGVALPSVRWGEQQIDLSATGLDRE